MTKFACVYAEQLPGTEVLRVKRNPGTFDMYFSWVFGRIKVLEHDRMLETFGL